MTLENAFGDLALDASVVAGNALLTAILAAVADLDANTDTIEALLAAIGAAVADLDTNTDNIETLLASVDASIGAGNASLVAIDNNTNNVEATLLSILAAVADLDTNTDGIEALITATNAALGTIDTRVDGLEGLTTTTNALLTTLVGYLDPFANGLSAYRNISTLNVGSIVKASPGKVYSIAMSNDIAGDRFVKLYNTAGVPTAADTPVQVFGLLETDAPVQMSYEGGLDFSLGIGVRATTGIDDADNGAPGANDVIVNIAYR